MFAIFYTNSVISDNIDSDKLQWEMYRNEYGITGYERKVNNSKYIETRAEALIDTPIETILEVLKDTTSYPNWMYNCKQAIELENNKSNARLLYIVQGSPLGSPDRDVIIQADSTVDWELGAYIISLQSSQYDLLQHPEITDHFDRQRMTEFRGKWEFHIVDRNNTKAIYTVFTDPGGFAPGFIVNSMMRKVSFLSIKGLIPMLRERRYTEAANLSQAKKLIEANWKKNNVDNL
jgi:hypothetical protein